MKKGRIILLNGVSSSGKTSLARKLQDQSPYPIYRMDVDSFASMTPEKFNHGKDYYVQYKFLSKMFHAVRLFSDMGFDLVVPCIFLEGGSFLEDCVTLLHANPVLFVHTACPTQELRRRETQRGDRKAGEAESQLDILVPQDTYDITVDTHALSLEECADKILQMANSPEKFSAFHTLWADIQL